MENNPLNLWQAKVPMTPRIFKALKKDIEEFSSSLTEEEKNVWKKKTRRLEYLYKRFTSSKFESKPEAT